MFTLSRRCLQRDSTSAVLPLPSHDTTRAKQVGAASGGIREALAQARAALKAVQTRTCRPVRRCRR